MRLISKKSKQEILNIKLYCINPDISGEGYFNFKEEDGELFLDYGGEVILYFMRIRDGYLFQMRAGTWGTNSDLYFFGDIEIGFIGQLLKENILEWDNEQ